MRLIPAAQRLLALPFVRFVLVGALNTAFGFGVFTVIEFFLHNTYYSVVLATIVGIIFNFKTYSKLVFNTNDNRKIIKFFAVYLVMLSVQLAAVRGLVAIGVQNHYLQGGIITLPIAVASYLLMKRWVFAKD